MVACLPTVNVPPMRVDETTRPALRGATAGLWLVAAPAAAFCGVLLVRG